MSFQRGSKDSHNDQELSSLLIYGGRDCKPELPLRLQGPDLWVKGGAIVEKSLCVYANIHVAEFLIGNVCATQVFTEELIAKDLVDIDVIGNLVVEPGFDLVATIRTNCISDFSGNAVEPVAFKTDIDMLKNDIVNVGNLAVCGLLSANLSNVAVSIEVMDDLDMMKHDILNIGNATVCHTLTVPNIEGLETLSGPGDILICTQGDIELKPMGGNLILHNTAFSFDLTQNILSNVMCVQTGMGVDLQLKTNPGFRVVIADGDGLDLDCRDICQVDNFEVASITAKDNNEIDFMCGNLGNVQSLYVDDMFGKASPVHFQDELNIASAGVRITFDDGIVVGNVATTASTTSAMAIGKGATAAQAGAIAIGYSATTADEADISIGKDAVAQGGFYASAISIGAYAYTERYGCIAIGGGNSNYMNAAAKAYQNEAIAIGYYARSKSVAVAIGSEAVAEYQGVAIGTNTNAKSVCVAIGTLAEADSGGIAIGELSNATVASAGYGSVAIGRKAAASGYHSVALGPGNVISGSGATALGNKAISIGHKSVATQNYAVALGADASATGTYAIAIGGGILTNRPIASVTDQIVIGRPTPSSSTATASAWGQVFQNRAWDDGMTALASINASGDIIKGGSLMTTSLGGTSLIVDGTGPVQTMKGLTGTANEIVISSLANELIIGLDPVFSSASAWTSVTLIRGMLSVDIEIKWSRMYIDGEYLISMVWRGSTEDEDHSETAGALTSTTLVVPAAYLPAGIELVGAVYRTGDTRYNGRWLITSGTQVLQFFPEEGVPWVGDPGLSFKTTIDAGSGMYWQT